MRTPFAAIIAAACVVAGIAGCGAKAAGRPVHAVHLAPRGPAPYGELFAWSGDKQRALFGHVPARGQNDFGPTYELNLRTGKFTRIPIDPKSLVVDYTRPRGDQLLVEGSLNEGTGVGTVELAAPNGKVTTKLWRGFIAADPVPTPDGKDYVIATNDNNYLVSSTGAVVGHLSSHGGCGLSQQLARSRRR